MAAVDNPPLDVWLIWHAYMLNPTCESLFFFYNWCLTVSSSTQMVCRRSRTRARFSRAQEPPRCASRLTCTPEMCSHCTWLTRRRRSRVTYPTTSRCKRFLPDGRALFVSRTIHSIPSGNSKNKKSCAQSVTPNSSPVSSHSAIQLSTGEALYSSISDGGKNRLRGADVYPHL